MAKGLTQESRERLKAVIVEQIAPRFTPKHGERWQSAVATELDVNQATVSRIVAEHPTGGSMEFVEKVADYLNLFPEEVLYGRKDEQASPRLRDLPGFAQALEMAKVRIREEKRDVTDLALERAADYRGRPALASVTAELLIGLASNYPARTPKPPPLQKKT